MYFRRNFYLSLYFIADPSLCMDRDVAFIAAQAIDGGATAIQLRNKSGDMNETERQARNILAVARPAGIPLIINDHVEIALKVDADGVHLGQGDMKPEQARRILGRHAIIGQTAFTPEHMQAIKPAIVDYAGTGPFYETQTDKGKPVLGAVKFRELVNLSPVPVVGIGGITPDNAAAVIENGAAGVAVMRAISEATDPAAVTCKLARVVKSAQLPPYRQEAL